MEHFTIYVPCKFIRRKLKRLQHLVQNPFMLSNITIYLPSVSPTVLREKDLLGLIMLGPLLHAPLAK